MRAIYEDIAIKKGSDSFLAYHLEVSAFEFKWHYHPEYELTLITHGKGKRVVGDNTESFVTGDLVLLGPGLPHTWSSDVPNQTIASAVVVQFSEEFIQNFLHLNGFDKISKLLELSARGLFFHKTKDVAMLEKIPTANGVERVTMLLNFLQTLTDHEFVKLSSEYFHAVKGEETENRINKVCAFVQQNSSTTIVLEHVAELINLSPSAFCKFFKRSTGKTFSEYVNDIRIGNACQLLTESDKAISWVAYETGFESLTYFNRVFLKKKAVTPRGFRRMVG